jgi:hypothetical protein
VVVTAAGRVAAGRVVEAESEAREAARVGGVSMLERDAIPGRFGVGVVDDEGVRVDLRSAGVLLGVARAAALVTVAGRRTVGVDFFLSSPDMRDETSGSASDAFVLEGWAARRAKELAAGRVAGLLAVAVRVEGPVGGRVVVAAVAARGVADADAEADAEAEVALVVGRRTGWAPKVPRRGGAGSLLFAGELDEAMAWRGRRGAVAFSSPLEVGDARSLEPGAWSSELPGVQQQARCLVLGCGDG